MYADRTLTCADCGQEFMFSADDQRFYAERGFTEPRRCPSCRAIRKANREQDGGGGGWSSSRGGGGGYGRSEPREMFTATCANCGREAQVPFRPTSGRPVYCADCFASRRTR
jgi:CxxC-x17-CxxC domain-containing protein